MMMPQGNGNDNDDAHGLSTNTKHSRFHDDIHDDNDIEDNIDELYTNAFAFHKFEHIENHNNVYAKNIQGVNSFRISNSCVCIIQLK